MKAFAKRFALVFALWTLVSICGGLADYLFSLALGGHLTFWGAFRRPLTEQWIWAALTPLVFLIAHHFPLSRPRLPRAIGMHVAAFLTLSLLHCLLAELVGGPLAVLPAHYTGPTLPLRFLEEFYSDIWMYWPLVCIQALMDSHARTRERERRAAELEALLGKSHLAFLRARIQPHFLFNTLHALSALIRSDALAAEDMVADLAEILRASSADSGLQETTLRSELDLVACYLRIQQRRFGDRLRVIQVVAPELLDAAVPPLVLQSIVENAVIHGIAPLDRSGTVAIRAYRREEQLVLQVEDDGMGMQSGGSTGVGLSNARRRMHELYGDKQSLYVMSAPGQGVSALVCIPFRVLPRSVQMEGVSRDHTDADSGRRSARAAEPVVASGS
jgi:two-component system LytT family sensor kinase